MRLGGLEVKASREPEGGAMARLTVDMQSPMHHVHQLFGNRKAEPCTTILPCCGTVCLRERIKNPRLHVSGNADAGILHGTTQDNLVLLFAHPGDMDTHLAVRCKLNGVPDKIRENLTEA